jgi:hypothetical protein
MESRTWASDAVFLFAGVNNSNGLGTMSISAPCAAFSARSSLRLMSFPAVTADSRAAFNAVCCTEAQCNNCSRAGELNDDPASDTPVNPSTE